ncbi:MAG TPA: CARDB domain-containing protein [Anaerolineae bacterium]|nr:CARDB domain-containing protein [Anaerolineae bacterium]
MNQRPRLLGGMVIACLALTLYFVVNAPAAADLTTLTHTTLEEFNTGVLYHTGLTREDDGEVQLLVVGIAGDWIVNTNTTGLPARDRHTAVHHNGHIIVVGGKEIDNVVKGDVYYTTIDPISHDLANWQKTTALPPATYPEGLGWHASVVVHDRIYVLGGYDDLNQYYNTVSFAPINANGSVGSWSTTAPLPEALRLLQAAVVNDRIYVVGGRSSTETTNRVYFATPDPATGQIGGWTETTPFAYATRAHMVAVQDDVLYVMGGTEGAAISPKVHYARPDPVSGVISGYTSTTVMRNNLYGGAGLAYNGVLFTTGGAINQFNTPSSYVGANLIATSGGVGSWQDTSLVEPERFYHAAVHSDDGWLYVIHGNNGYGPISSINRGATAGAARNYAPEGTYTSRTIELPKGSQLKELSWSTTITDPAVSSINLWYRARLTASAAWPAWSGPYSSAVQGTVTHTVPLDGIARYFEYRADFATTESDQTPRLNAFQLVYLPPVYSIRLTKGATPPSGSVVYPENVVEYTLTYSNSLTGLTATNAYILELVPDHMQYVPGTIYGVGADDTNAPELRWSLGDVAPGGQGEVGFDAVVLEDYAQEVIIENRANLFSTAGPVKYSNVITHTAKPLIPELEVWKSADPPHGSQVTPGSRITYNNPSIFLAEAAVLSDTYDLCHSYEVVSTDPLASDPSNSIWQLGNVPAGDSGEVQVVVEVGDALPNHWIITNDVTLSYDSMLEPATDVVTHMVVYDGVPLVDFLVEDLRWEPADPAPDQEVKFYATVTNQGTVAASQYFWVSLYIKPQPSTAPLGAYDHIGGYCLDVACATPRPHFLAYVSSLAPGASVELSFQNLEPDPVFPASGAYDVYVQADMSFEGAEYNPYWGRYTEDYEQNNLWHDVLVIDDGTPRIYLPIVSCADR